MAAQPDDCAAQPDSAASTDEVISPKPPVSKPHADRMADLFDRYHKKLVKTLAARTRSWDEARDIAAQAFTDVLALERPGSVEFFASYLYRTARNLVTDRLRHQSVKQRKDCVVQYDLTHGGSSPEQDIQEDEQQATLQRAIDNLPPRPKMVLVLRIFHGLSYEEIINRFAAEGVQLTERTARRHLTFAYQHIRREIVAAENPFQGDGV